MESSTLSNILNGEINQLVGVSYEQNPCYIVLRIDEVDDWIADQEQILGVKWLKRNSEAESISSFRVERYYCHRQGKKRHYISTVPEHKKRLNQKPSIKMECKAYFWVRQRPGTEDVDIVYHWKHQNHLPGNINHFDYSRFPKKICTVFKIIFFLI